MLFIIGTDYRALTFKMVANYIFTKLHRLYKKQERISPVRRISAVPANLLSC